jgi:hypothetical protein
VGGLLSTDSIDLTSTYLMQSLGYVCMIQLFAVTLQNVIYSVNNGLYSGEATKVVWPPFQGFCSQFCKVTGIVCQVGIEINHCLSRELVSFWYSLYMEVKVGKRSW